MKPKLPRALLWTDKDSLDEFMNEPVNRDMFEMLFKIRRDTILLKDAYYSATKFFNEVYYQCTRIVYEQDKDAFIHNYLADIKSNIGTYNHARVVYGLIFYLLFHRNNNSLTEKKFASNFLLCYVFNGRYQIEFPKETESSIKTYDIDLSPRPCSTSSISNMLIDWDEVTNHYDKESIDCIVNLYDEVTERKNIYNMIEKAYERFLRNQGKNILELKRIYPNIADYQFFFDYNEVKSSGFSEQPLLCREDEAPIFPTYRELEEENVSLKQKLEEALSENESLKSKLNMTKPKRQQETSFTVGKIVDYCKRIPEYRSVEAIEKMLYKFIKDCSDKEEKLIDSISEHFNNKKYGDTVMGDKNGFYGNSGLNQITLPPGAKLEDAIKYLQAKDSKKNGKERMG